MAKRITVTEQKTTVARPDRWEFFVVTHDRDERVSESSKRLDVIIYFGDAIPQRKIENALGGLTPAQKNAVKGWFIGLADLMLEEHANDNEGVSTETDDEDALE